MKLVLNVKYLSFLPFLTPAEFYNLGRRYYMGALAQKISFLVICATFRPAFHVG